MAVARDYIYNEITGIEHEVVLVDVLKDYVQKRASGLAV
jgi:hypothetical protein